MDEAIGMVSVIRLTGPDGVKTAIFGSDEQHEVLSIYTIEYLDRRLGVLSPFRSVPRA